MHCPERTSPGGWLVTPAPNAHARRRLICFAYAGGGPTLFRGWAREFASTELVAVQLPGRESRFHQPPLEDFLEILSNVCRDISAYCLDKPYVLFGYSLGSILAFETARALRAAALRQPRALLVAARRAPQLPLRDPPTHLLDDARFVERLRSLQGTPPQLFEDPQLLELLLPMLRADFKLHETYRLAPGEAFDYPLFAFGGTTDSAVHLPELLAWRVHTRSAFAARTFTAGHFFIHTHRRELLAEITAALDQVAPLHSAPAALELAGMQVDGVME